MYYGGWNNAEARADSDADVFHRAGFLGDDDLIGHDPQGWNNGTNENPIEYNGNNSGAQLTFWSEPGFRAILLRLNEPQLDDPRRPQASPVTGGLERF